MTISYLSIGSNIGDREDYLKKAIEMISRISKTRLIKISSFYQTPAWGLTEQQDFLNACLEISTELSPYDLLKNLQRIEMDLHRERLVRWGPRTIDIDILTFGDIICEDVNLVIPHPLISKRAFVLVPLLELNPDLIIGNKSIKEMIEVIDVSDIKEYKRNDV